MFFMWRFLVVCVFSLTYFSSVTYAQDAQIEFVLKKLEGGVYNLYDTTIYCDFISGANPGIDGFDAPKADQFNENLSIYRNGRDWFTETRPLVNCNDTIQLRLYKMKTASYQLKVDMSFFLAQSGLTAILQDAQLNTERVLNFGQIALINFSNSVTSSFRFRIVFRRTLVETSPFTQLPAVCSGQLINLPTASSNNITGSWAPAVNNTQTTTYSFIPSEGQCATSPNMTVQVNQPVTPTFTQVAAICSGETFTLPTTSNNGIIGTWSPVINATQSTTYTFTPTQGQCATTTTMTVTVNQLITPTFTEIAAICSGGTFTLPTTSNNNIAGTWSPAIDNTKTTAYTFTPTAGQCATTTAMTVTVNQPLTPTFTQVSPICIGGAIVLPTTSNNSINGSWSPAIDNTQTTTYTFTPTQEQCATTTTMTVTVNQPITPTFTEIAAICSGGTFTLPTTSNNNIAGTWSPAIDNTKTTAYTFTPTAGQCATATTMMVTVNQNLKPTINCGTNNLSSVEFVWSNVAGATGYNISYVINGAANPFAATGVSSPYLVSNLNNGDEVTLTVIPSGATGACLQSETKICKAINCTPADAGTISGEQEVCVGNTTVFVPAVSGGVWATDDSSIAAVNPNGVVLGIGTGTTTITYRILNSIPGCAYGIATRAVTVNQPVKPTFTQISAICSGGTFTLPTTSNNNITGTWSPAINNTQTTTYTFTPNQGQCAATSTMTVTVNQPVTPSFTQVAAICSGGTFTLPTTSNNGISGTWLPAIDNTQTTTYTFTPNAGQCADTASMTVTVDSRNIPVFTQVQPICSGNAISLPDTSNNGILGTWSPAINNTQTTTYTFTPTVGQCTTTATMTVTVNPPVTPTFTQVGPFNSGSNFTLPSVSNNGIKGSWSPDINNIQTTNYTFTPDAGQCSGTAQITVTINIPTSLVDRNLDKGFKIYPNPVVNAGILQLAFQNKAAGLYSITLMNITGARIQQAIVSHPGGSAVHFLNLDNRIGSGIYLIEIMNEKGRRGRIKMVLE
jgi:serine protease inhibitor